MKPSSWCVQVHHGLMDGVHIGRYYTQVQNYSVYSFQDEVLEGLTPQQLRYCSPQMPHSAVWKLWHIARIEDVTLNLLLADSPQVLHSGGWLDRVGVGNEMSEMKIAELSAAINVKALLDYRLAVGKRTRSVVRRLKAVVLWQPPAPDRLQRLFDAGSMIDRTTWLRDYWGGHPAANLLLNLICAATIQLPRSVPVSMKDGSIWRVTAAIGSFSVTSCASRASP